MNKTFNVLITIVLLILLVWLTACTETIKPTTTSISANTPTDTADTTPVITATASSESSAPQTTTPSPTTPIVSVTEQVLLDRNDIIITLKSLDINGMFGPTLKVHIENNRKESVTVQTRSLAINGAMIGSAFSCDVDAENEADGEIIFIPTELETAGIDIIKDIEFYFTALNSTFETIFISDTIHITTDADPAFIQTYDDSGTMILDQNGIRVVIKETDYDDNYWGVVIYIYVENNTDKNAALQIRDMSVNGKKITPVFPCEILPGKISYAAIAFYETDLVDNNIETIEELAFWIRVFDMGSLNVIFDSDPIVVSLT